VETSTAAGAPPTAIPFSGRDMGMGHAKSVERYQEAHARRLAVVGGLINVLSAGAGGVVGAGEGRINRGAGPVEAMLVDGARRGRWRSGYLVRRAAAFPARESGARE